MPPNREVSEDSTRGHTIMVVDDCTTSLHSIKRTLTRKGYSVVGFTSPVEAAEFAQSEQNFRSVVILVQLLLIRQCGVCIKYSGV